MPHQPYSLQQVPKEEPAQVKPLLPEQVPSVETFLVEEGVAATEALVLEAGLGLVVAGLGVLTAAAELTTPFPPQLPKPVWQPVPQ